MRKRLLPVLLLLLALALPAAGQDYLLRNYHGQGEGREAATDALLSAIGADVHLSPARLLETYRDEISRAAVETRPNGKTILSLDGTALDGIFQARQTRTAQILDEGRKASDPAVRMTYYRWAWYYLCSLPPGHELPGKEEIRQWMAAHPDVAPGKLPVPMTHIEREVGRIRRIVGEIPIGSSKKETPVRKEVTAPAEVPRPVEPVRAALSAIAPVPISKEVVASPSPVFSPEAPVWKPAPAIIARQPLKTSILVTAGLAPEPVFGGVVCIRRKWGAVLSFESDFHRPVDGYPAYSDGRLPAGDGFLWPSGKSRRANLRVTAGPSFAVLPWLDAYLGAGYGYRLIGWEDQDKAWARMEDLSAQGAALTGGVIVHYKWLSTGVETGTVSFRTLGVSLGLGITF